MFEAKEIFYKNNDWITLVFFTIFIILVVIKLSFNERLSYTSVLFFSKKRVATYFNKEKRNIFNWYQILFFVIQLLVFSLLFFEIISHVKPSFSALNFNIFLLILVSCFLYFVFRYLIGLFLASIFDLTKIHKKILYEKINYLNGMVLNMLPVMLLLYYVDVNTVVFSRITIIMFVLLLGLSYVWVVRNNKNFIFSNLLYFILYLCALEIAPLVIILKLTI